MLNRWLYQSGVVIALFLSLPSCQQSASTSSSKSSPRTNEEIEQIVHAYLLENPGILQEMVTALQEKQRLEASSQLKATVVENKTDLFHSEISTGMGNSDGAVVIVEFLDYRCSHCIRSHEIIRELLRSNDEVYVVIKHLPIFGELSNFMARANLAAERQGKGAEFHEVLMQEPRDGWTNEKTLDAADQVGIDVAQLKRDMDTPVILQQIEKNRIMARSLGIKGTPAFLVAENPLKNDENLFLVPGALSKEQLQSLVDRVQAPKSAL